MKSTEEKYFIHAAFGLEAQDVPEQTDVEAFKAALLDELSDSLEDFKIRGTGTLPLEDDGIGYDLYDFSMIEIIVGAAISVPVSETTKYLLTIIRNKIRKEKIPAKVRVVVETDDTVISADTSDEELTDIAERLDNKKK